MNTCPHCGSQLNRNGERGGAMSYRCSNKQCGKSLTVRDGVIVSKRGPKRIKDWRTQSTTIWS